MKISELLKSIDHIAKQNSFSQPFVCGGLPRDRVLGLPIKNFDVDITTGDDSIQYLAKECSIYFKNYNPRYTRCADGHSFITIGKTKVDFSSNFIVPNINKILVSKGIDNPTKLDQEMFSRDFTCNTLLMTLDLKSIKDPIGLGMKDIKNKILRTCLPVKVTLGLDNKRVSRVISMASKLNFRVDDSIKQWIIDNPETLISPGQTYVSKNLHKAFNYNSQVATKLISELDLWSYVPATEELLPFIKKYSR